ncbi:uncharacterized protein with ParB-like and HNH nuclease domain [Streptacidiphilus sp. MAP12-16]|uniref:DUF262 domain-containing protein n=1 Tax=Streptacidiphilus sp. MAP12-16 TaxID=3156300 RepID=UPI003519460C
MDEVVSASPDQLIRAVDMKISAVRTQSLDFSFNELANMHAEGELIIDPEFQRMFRWTEGAQARFIESLLLELPVPPIFLIERDDRIYELIDGLQRISSFLHFRGQLVIDDKKLEPLILSDCDIVKELNGKSIKDLPRALDIKLKRSYIRAEILRKESDPRLRYYMFKRLNTGGERLAEQEVRNATIRLLSNDFNQFIVSLSRNTDFSASIDAITENAVRRKFDQELVLRFFSFKNAGELYRHDIADFLTDYMEAVSDPTAPTEFDYEEERKIFEKTFRVIKRISDILDYGSRIFGTIAPSGQPKSQFSVYHYEGIALGIQRVIDRVNIDDDVQMQALADVVKSGKVDQKFLKATGGGKNERNALKARVGYFEDRFDGALA